MSGSVLERYIGFPDCDVYSRVSDGLDNVDVSNKTKPMNVQRQRWNPTHRFVRLIIVARGLSTYSTGRSICNVNIRTYLGSIKAKSDEERARTTINKGGTVECTCVQSQIRSETSCCCFSGPICEIQWKRCFDAASRKIRRTPASQL